MVQVGSAFWQRLCAEHGINKNGILEEWATDRGDRFSNRPTMSFMSLDLSLWI